MLKIKLTRIGKKGQPQYHVVVIEDKTKLGTRNVDRIGYYNPLSTPKEFRLDIKSYEAWMVKGARPTDTVRSLALKHVATPVKPTKSTTAKPKAIKKTK